VGGQDAEGVERVGLEGSAPLPMGVGSGKGAVPPPQKTFRILSLKRRHFTALFTLLNKPESVFSNSNGLFSDH